MGIYFWTMGDSWNIGEIYWNIGDITSNVP
jgi:hypothetical protein